MNEVSLRQELLLIYIYTDPRAPWVGGKAGTAHTDPSAFWVQWEDWDHAQRPQGVSVARTMYNAKTGITWGAKTSRRCGSYTGKEDWDHAHRPQSVVDTMRRLG